MPGIKFALGENVKRSSQPNQPGVTRRYPSTRMGVEEVIRDAFTRAVITREPGTSIALQPERIKT